LEGLHIEENRKLGELTDHENPCLIENLCSKVLILDHGRKIMTGKSDEMIAAYLNLKNYEEKLSGKNGLTRSV